MLAAKAQTLTGTVTIAESPIAGANITVQGKTAQHSASQTTTNSDGSFSLNLQPGTYQIVASHVGYSNIIRKVSLVQGQTLNLNFQLNSSNQMEEVVVVSSRKPSKISDIPGTVWVVNKERLQEQIKAGIPLKEALAQLIPGLDAGPQGRTNYGQNLRGRNILVMIDGVSLNSTRGISRQFDAIDPFNIERIEVLSGASSIYGGGATGGIVNIITKRGESGAPAFSTEAGARSSLKQKTDHDLRFAQSISGGNENWNGRIGIAFQKNNAAFDANNEQIFTDITQTDLQYNRSFDVFANTEFKLSKKQTLRLSGQFYNSAYDGTKDLYLGTNLAGLLGNASLLQLRDGFSSAVIPATTRYGLTADYHAADILGGQDLYIQASGRHEKFSFHPFPAQAINPAIPGGRLLYSSSSIQNTAYNAAKIVLSKQWSNLNLTYGIDYDNEKFNASQVLFDRVTAAASGGLTNNKLTQIGRYPGFEVNGLSGFAQAALKITEKLNLSAGVRQQRMYVQVDAFAGADPQALIAYGLGKTADLIPGGKNHYDVNLLNGGLVYKITEPMQIWANYAQGFNLADPAKYYGQGTYQLSGANWKLLSGTSVGSNPLTGIKTDQLETGYRFGGSKLHAQIAGFYSWSAKNLRVVPVTLAVEVIDQKRRNYGAEGSISYSLSQSFDIGANGIYIQSEKNDGSWKAQDISDASPSKATAYLGWKSKGLGLKVQGFHSFNLKDATDNQLKGYTTLDLLGNIKLPAGVLNFGVQNLLNKDYQTIWSQRSQVLYKGLAVPQTFYYAGRGRTYNLTYTLNY
jgi:iron complex outermembrane receptor protein